MISEGLSGLTQVFTFMSGNDLIKMILGFAVAGIGISVFLGLFFRGR